MSYQINFGSLTAAKSPAPAAKTRSFRIAVMGDFSGRANHGELETGEALAGRKPLKVDCDNFDEIVGRFGLKLTLPLGTGSVEIDGATLEDLHPDQLYANLPIFGELAGLRQRLKNKSTFAKAAQDMQGWAGGASSETAAPRGPARGQTVPADGKLSDFAQLVGRPSAGDVTDVGVHDLIKAVVAPHVVAAKDPQQDVLVAAVDQALTALMREVLHHPDFQALESLWRSVDFLVRRLETDAHLQIVLIDVSAEELVADASREDGLENSGLYQLLVEQPAHDAHQGPFSLIIGHYLFDHTPPHADVLGRLAKIAAQAGAPFVSAIASGCVDIKPADIHPLIQDAWSALRAIPEASFVGLTVPRFLLRLPYGNKTEPIDAFEFEEFAPHIGLRGMLWGNSAILAAALLGASFSKAGAKMTSRAVLSIGDLPFYYFTDKDGDQIALPCTERLLTSRVAGLLHGHGFIPVLAIKGTPEIRFAGFQSLAGSELAGWWAPPASAPPAAKEPDAAEAPVDEPETKAQTSAPTESPSGTDESVSLENGASTNEAAAAGESSLDDLLAAVGIDEPAASGDDGGLSDLDNLLAAAAQVEPPAQEGETASDLDKLLGDLG